MNNKTRNLLKALALIIVVLCVLIELNFVSIPAINPHKFWLMVVAFGMVLISSR